MLAVIILPAPWQPEKEEEKEKEKDETKNKNKEENGPATMQGKKSLMGILSK
eukprot:evm.model.NODE_37385_length_20398_cov_24.877586.5